MSMRPEDRRDVATDAGTVSVPRYRVVTCHRWSHGPGPAVWRSPAGEGAEFADVHTCGSVWHCPVCAGKITSGRRDELLAAIAAWTDPDHGRGGEVYLATRTFSHDKHSTELLGPVPEGGKKPSSPLLEAFADALSRAKGKRRALACAERAGVIGTVRALEVTHGEINGWHPHTHELIFALPGQRGRLLSHRNGWIRELIKRGLSGMRDTMTRAERAEQLRYLRRHAYTVQDGRFAAEYVSKFGMEPTTEEGGRWGHASELTKGHQKFGKRLTGRTPFTLLRQYVEGDRRAGFLFRDFALAFQGRSQLYWSPRLRTDLSELAASVSQELYYRCGASVEQLAWAARARCIARDRSDEDIAASRSAACTEFVIRLGSDDWRAVLRTNSRHDVLMAAQLGGEAEVRELLERLRGERATHGDSFLPDFRRFDRGAMV